MAVEKLKRDGKVAVLVSPGYGAGWSTWIDSKDAERAVFDPEIAAAVLDGKDATDVAKTRFPDAYTGGVSDLTVEWVPEGTRFRIQEYDGAESLEVMGPDYGFVA